MISLVAQTINWCVSCVLSVLSAAAFVGQTIVAVVATALSAVATVCGFLADVYEDNRNLFTLELPSMVIGAPAIVLSHFCEAGDALAAALSDVYITLADPLSASVYKIYWNFTHAAVSLKQIFIVVGDSIWLIITFIPIQLPALLGSLCSWLWHASVEAAMAAYASLLRITNFLTDVPLQSMVGIVSAVAVVRLFVEFRAEIMSRLAETYQWTVRALWLYYYSVYNYLTDDEATMIAQIVQDGRPRPLNVERLLDERREETERADALCVVCQERQKCVLTLPCRHICLCCECCVRLYNYQRTCPICRTFICHSVNVYY